MGDGYNMAGREQVGLLSIPPCALGCKHLEMGQMKVVKFETHEQVSKKRKILSVAKCLCHGCSKPELWDPLVCKPACLES